MEDAERLIVYFDARFQQFERELKKAERTGTWTYQKLVDGSAKASTSMEKRMMDTAKSMNRSLDSVLGRDLSSMTRREFNALSREFLASKDAVDRLMASLDPAVAATQRYEAAVADLDRALAANAISEGEHAAAIKLAKSSYDDHTASLGKLGGMSNATKASLQNMGFQVQDTAVQIAGGTSAAKALGQQLPQMLGSFGLVGVAVGTLVSVGLPLLTAAFGNSEAASKSFDDALSDVQNSIRAVADAAATFTAEGMVELQKKYGEVNAELLRFVDLQAQAAQRQAFDDARAAMSSLIAETESWNGILVNGLTDIFPGVAGQVNHLADAMRDVQRAATFEDQLAGAIRLREKILQLTGGVENMTDAQFAFYLKVQKSEDALRQLVAAAPKAGWLSGMIGQAETLAGKLWDAVKAKAQLAEESDPSHGQDTGSADWAHTASGVLLNGTELIGLPKPAAKSKRGGGGGRTSSVIEGVISDLQKESEAVAAWYAESLAAINAATDAQLAAIGGRHSAIERLEAEHQARLRAVRDESNTGALAATESFFGSMATLFAAGGDRMVKAQRVTAAAEALINTYRAQAQVLAQPNLTWWQKLAAYAQIGAAGMKVVSALGGAGTSKSTSGTSSSSSSSSTAATATSDPLTVILKGLKGVDPAALFTGQNLIDLSDSILKEFGNRGIKLVGQS